MRQFNAAPIFCLLLGIVTSSWAVVVLPTELSRLNHTHVQFRWLPADAAQSYQLWVVEDNGSADPFEGTPAVVDLLVEGTETTTVVTSGLVFGTNYAWRVRGFDPDALPWGPTRRFRTQHLPSFMPEMNMEFPGNPPPEPGLTMFNVRFDDTPMTLLVTVDLLGEPVWFLERSLRAGDLRLLENGRILFIEEGRAYETTLDGVVTWASPDDPDLYVHHEVFPMPNGNFLALVEVTQAVMLPGAPFAQMWLGDRLVEFDRETNEIVWDWNTFDHFSTEDFDPTVMEAPQNDGRFDWTHANAVIYNEADNSVYMSARHLSRITRIDYDTGEIIYNMGFDMPSGDTDFGDNLFSFQHAPEMLPNGNMMVYDNGNRRDHQDQTGETGVSKAIELAFFGGDPPASAFIVWEYVLPEYQPFVGDADRLPGGNTLITAGVSETLIEVDPAASEVWRLQAIGTDIPVNFIYRSERIAELVVVLNSADLNGDGRVGVADLLILFAEWGPCADCDNCPADLNGDCVVGVGDMLLMFANWG